MVAGKRKSFTNCTDLISGATGEKCNNFNTALDLIQTGTPKETAVFSVNRPQDHPFIFIRSLKDINS